MRYIILAYDIHSGIVYRIVRSPNIGQIILIVCLFKISIISIKRMLEIREIFHNFECKIFEDLPNILNRFLILL